jgi:hypothetical protein
LLLQIIKRIHAFFVAKIIKQIHILLLQKSSNKSMFSLLQIFKQIHVLVVANFTQILKSIKRPPAIRKSFLCQKEIQQEKIKSINQSNNQLTYNCTSNSTWKL